ncbi:unnamed protein product [Merluccius merluccius]
MIPTVESSVVVTHEAVEVEEDGGDQAKVIVGVVVGLIIAAALVSGIYWIFMRSRQGTWTTNEKEEGTSEEKKELEEPINSV